MVKMTKTKVWVTIVLLVIVMSALGVTIFLLDRNLNKGSSSSGSSETEAREAEDGSPTMTPSSIFWESDTVHPSMRPSSLPTIVSSRLPSSNPSNDPTMSPVTKQTARPSSIPTIYPTDEPSLLPTATIRPADLRNCDQASAGTQTSKCDEISIFYAIADAPYDITERLQLPQQILDVPDYADFLIHLGDIRSASKEDACTLQDYEDISAMLKLSKVPVFIVVGDNEWNDCSNINTAWEYWQQELVAFEDHWNHNFQIQRHPNRPENFAFIHKRTLYVGLNLVGGRVHDQNEWNERHSDLVVWTIQLIRDRTNGGAVVEQVRSVVLFGHANPTFEHDLFFNPLVTFIRMELAGDIPVLYMNGDAHVWSYDPAYRGAEMLLRVQLTGGTSEPPLKVIVANTDDVVDSNAENVFLYDRQLR